MFLKINQMNIKIKLFFTFLFTLYLSSCNNDEIVADNFLSYSVEIIYPESYGNAVANGVEVKLKNLNTNRVLTVTTDSNGRANFEQLVPGNYSLAATKTLTANESEIITGISSEAYLNATVAQVQILDAGSTKVQLDGGAVGDWVIKEFYYSGAPNSYYFYDSFIEIYNNSTETLYADGLLFGSTKSATSSQSSFYGFVTQGYQDAFLAYAFRIPGLGTEYPVAPGESIVIAIDAIDHKTDPNGNANSPVNLGKGIADFEVYYYVNPKAPDTDNPDVPNVEILYATSTSLFDYLPGVMGSGLVVFKSDDPDNLERMKEPNTTSSTQYLRVPREQVIDALDAAAKTTMPLETKRLPTVLDAGINSVGNSYTGTSLRRKIKQEINGRKVLLDTNNSANDFEINQTPNPKGW